MDKETKPKEQAESILRAAVDFQAASMQSRLQTCETFINQEPKEHNTFRVTLDGLIARTIQQLANKIENSTDKISYQIGVAISFVRTHFIINDMIMNGDLIEAFTLIRKNFESVTRLHEIDEKPLLKLFKKTPNVINIFKEGGKQLYPTLSEIAHFGTPRVSELLTITSKEDGRTGPSLLPIYNPDAPGCYDRHAYVSIYFAFWLIQFLKTIYSDKYNAEADEEMFVRMTKLAEETGIIVRQKEKE